MRGHDAYRWQWSRPAINYRCGSESRNGSPALIDDVVVGFVATHCGLVYCLLYVRGQRNRLGVFGAHMLFTVLGAVVYELIGQFQYL